MNYFLKPPNRRDFFSPRVTVLVLTSWNCSVSTLVNRQKILVTVSDMYQSLNKCYKEKEKKREGGGRKFAQVRKRQNEGENLELDFLPDC